MASAVLRSQWTGRNERVEPENVVSVNGSETDEVPPPGPGPVALKHADFRRLFSASFISLIGTQMQQVALTWQMYELTGSAFALGLLGLFKAVPLISLALFGGVAADARDRRKLLIVTQGTLLAISSGLALSASTGSTRPWMIYLAVAAAAAVTAFDNPARASLIPNLVPREHLANALSLNILAWQIATVIGPAIAGNLIAWFGVTIVYSVDAVSFLAMIAALFAISAEVRVDPASRPGSGAIREGLQFVFSTPIIRSTMLLDFFATLFGCANTLMPMFATQVLGVGARGLGLLYAAPPAGAAIAGAVMSFMPAVRRQGKTVLWSIAVYGLATVAFGLSTWLPLSMVALAFTGAADSVSTVMRQTIRQLATPDSIRGRMTSVNMIFFMGGPQLGELEAGSLAALAGPAVSVGFGGIAVLVTVALAALLSPTLRTFKVGNESRQG